MCFESEAYDREDHMELSPFECIPGSLKKDGGIISITTGNGINNGNGASNEKKEWGTMMTTTTTTTPQRKAARHRPVHNPQFVVIGSNRGLFVGTYFCASNAAARVRLFGRRRRQQQ